MEKLIKLFVPYHLATQLRDIGFDELCITHYVSESYGLDLDPDEIGVNNAPLIKDAVSAPTYQQAFDWFREEKDLFARIECINTKTKDVWEYEVSSQNDRMVRRFVQSTTFGEIQNECLTRLIEIVKENRVDTNARSTR
jgi:hypothetical protein